MSFDKLIPSRILEYKIYGASSTDELIKEASEVDFPEGFVYDPDFLYMWVRIVSSGEYYGPNKNGDYFPNDELEAYFESFNEANAFKNHENKNVENAIGIIISVRWNPVMKCVEILKGIDKKRSPETARGYLKGYLTDVSMGCKVPYTVCSVCGNKARRKSEFCDHVKFHRLQFLGNGERVYEINYKPKFHDSSTVLNGAERVAKAFFIIDAPPKGVQTTSFKKVASANGSLHFKYADQLEKVASMQENMHPLLREPSMDKVAAQSPMMNKIAELEKELTGKLINIVSAKKQAQTPQASKMLQVIKFLTEKRLSESSLVNIAKTVKSVAEANSIPTTRAFATLLGVADLMGIEFFPHELDTLLKNVTDASLNPDLSLSDEGADSVYPSDYAKGIDQVFNDFEDAESFKDPSALMRLYDGATYDTDSFNRDGLGFLQGLQRDSELNQHTPVHVIRVIRRTLEPIMPSRSFEPEHLLPRLSVVLGGHRPLIGNGDVGRDVQILANPTSVGDQLARTAYSLYEKMRPHFAGTQLIKVAEKEVEGLTKQAAKYEPRERIGLAPKKKGGGLGVVPLAMAAIPAAYGASAYEKNRRENGRYLNDKENFVADKPGIVAAGAILAGKPLSRAVAKTGVNAKESAASTASKVKETSKNIIEKLKAPFTKQADLHEFENLVKVADDVTSGDYNVFQDREVLAAYMQVTNGTEEEASAVKMATILSLGGMDKEATEVMKHYNIPNHEKGRFLKLAMDQVEMEMDKAAEEFTNNMILSAFGDVNPLSRSLPGRAVDAFVLKKLNDSTKPKEQKQPKTPKPTTEGGNEHV